MHYLARKLLRFISLLSLVLLFGAYSTAAQKPERSMLMYEIHQDGRIYSFYDRSLNKECLDVGETAYRLIRIGAETKGETVVFGLTKKDKKMKHEIPTISIFNGKTRAPEEFYAKIRRHGRRYVFDRYEDTITVLRFGHPNYFYTEIGSDPKGKTVVYVLNKKNKKIQRRQQMSP